jgi:hypothetical protein
MNAKDLMKPEVIAKRLLSHMPKDIALAVCRSTHRANNTLRVKVAYRAAERIIEAA